MIQAIMTELSQKSGVKLDEIIKHLLDKCCYWETKWITWKDNLVGNNLVFVRNETKLYETLDVPVPYNKKLNTLSEKSRNTGKKLAHDNGCTQFQQVL